MEAHLTQTAGRGGKARAHRPHRQRRRGLRDPQSPERGHRPRPGQARLYPRRVRQGKAQGRPRQGGQVRRRGHGPGGVVAGSAERRGDDFRGTRRGEHLCPSWVLLVPPRKPRNEATGRAMLAPTKASLKPTSTNWASPGGRTAGNAAWPCKNAWACPNT